jgi:hypothetical protein
MPAIFLLPGSDCLLLPMPAVSAIDLSPDAIADVCRTPLVVSSWKLLVPVEEERGRTKPIAALAERNPYHAIAVLRFFHVASFRRRAKQRAVDEEIPNLRRTPKHLPSGVTATSRPRRRRTNNVNVSLRWQRAPFSFSCSAVCSDPSAAPPTARSRRTPNAKRNPQRCQVSSTSHNE